MRSPFKTASRGKRKHAESYQYWKLGHNYKFFFWCGSNKERSGINIQWLNGLIVILTWISWIVPLLHRRNKPRRRHQVIIVDIPILLLRVKLPFYPLFQSVGRSVVWPECRIRILSKGGKFQFHAPIRIRYKVIRWVYFIANFKV